MDLLVALLVQKVKTIDGTKGSACFYIEASISYEIQRRERRKNKRIQKQRDKILAQGPLARDEEFDDSL